MNKMANKEIKSLIGINKLGISLSVCEGDMKSFYSMNILTEKLCPNGDEKGEFYYTLKKLNEIRETKSILGDPINTEKVKLLIESLIGCLNNKSFCFYDFEAHESILLECKEIMKKIVQILKNYEEEGLLKIIRVHTDGIYLNVKKEVCLKKIFPELNDYLAKNWGTLYKFKFKGHHQRGLFKNVNNFFLWTQDKEPIVKGVFFKEYKELTSAFIQGYYNTKTGVPRDYSRYEELKEKLLKNPTKKLYSLLNYLEGVKSGYPMV